jgi:hypothetical protein
VLELSIAVVGVDFLVFPAVVYIHDRVAEESVVGVLAIIPENRVKQQIVGFVIIKKCLIANCFVFDLVRPYFDEFGVEGRAYGVLEQRILIGIVDYDFVDAKTLLELYPRRDFSYVILVDIVGQVHAMCNRC